MTTKTTTESNSTEILAYTVERECHPRGGRLRVLHIPINKCPYVVLAEFPDNSMGGFIRTIVTDSFPKAHREYERFKKNMLE